MITDHWLRASRRKKLRPGKEYGNWIWIVGALDDPAIRNLSVKILSENADDSLRKGTRYMVFAMRAPGARDIYCWTYPCRKIEGALFVKKMVAGGA